MTGTERVAVEELGMDEGDTEPVRIDEGESADDDSRLERRGWLPPAVEDSEFFGLSLPVGPLPRGGRLAGGRFRAARR
jgi:hypothetical protein